MGAGDLTIVGAASYSHSGEISGSGGLTMDGSGTQELTGATSFTGPVNVNAGTLLMGNDNVLTSSVDLTLDTGTFGTGGFSQNLNTLTLTDDSTIDFGNLSSRLNFNSGSLAALNGNTLLITNWTGDFDTTGGTDQLLFQTGWQSLIGNTEPQIQFQISGVNYDAIVLARTDLGANYVEIVPTIPEAESFIAILVLLLATFVRRYNWKPISLL